MEWETGSGGTSRGGAGWFGSPAPFFRGAACGVGEPRAGDERFVSGPLAFAAAETERSAANRGHASPAEDAR
jgi:hypothetical protein